MRSPGWWNAPTCLAVYLYLCLAQTGGAVDSAKVMLPDPKAFITLKKGNFDDVACKKYPDRCKKGGQGYVEGTAVNDLQDNIFIKLRFSPKSKADGDFGEHTERIIKEFQQCALEKKRKKDGRIIEIEKITYSGKAMA